MKPEWGAKRACPKCNTRFYDLTKDDPVTCIACGFAWVPDPILKSKQPLPFEAAKPVAAAAKEDDEALAGDDLDLEAEVEGDAVDDDDDLDGDDDLAGVVERDEDEES